MIIPVWRYFEIVFVNHGSLNIPRRIRQISSMNSICEGGLCPLNPSPFISCFLWLYTDFIVYAASLPAVALCVFTLNVKNFSCLVWFWSLPLTKIKFFTCFWLVCFFIHCRRRSLCTLRTARTRALTWTLVLSYHFSTDLIRCTSK